MRAKATYRAVGSDPRACPLRMDGRTDLASTMLPLAEWLAFNEALVRRYFSHLPNPYFWFGERSAQWSLTKGPYRNVLAGRTKIADFVDRAAILYANYYEMGRFALDLAPGRLDASIDDIPVAYHHPHFEFNPAGYVRQTLELLGAQAIVVEQRAGYSRGDARVAKLVHGL